MSPKPESAIEIIYEMKEMLILLNSRIDLLDKNIKLISNQLKKLKVVNNELEQNETPSSDNRIKLFGRFKQSDSTPMFGVEVKIFNEKNDFLKSRYSDKDGYWEIRVLPGKYTATFDASKINPKFKIVVKNFEVKVGTTEMEIK